MSTREEPICAECGFSVYSDAHKRGVGLHGHTSDPEPAPEPRTYPDFTQPGAYAGPHPLMAAHAKTAESTAASAPTDTSATEPAADAAPVSPPTERPRRRAKKD